MSLYPYQQQAVDRIVTSNNPTYLGFEMGLGKTRVALAVAQRRNAKRILVICPAIGRLAWEQEIAKVWPGSPPVVIVKSFRDIPRLKGECIGLLSYGLVSASKSGGYDYIDGLKKLPPFDFTVLDEAHALKNATAIRTRGVLIKLKAILGKVLPMSGTPAPNHAGELFPILKTLWPNVVRKPDGTAMNQFEFENEYCEVVQKFFNSRQVRVIEGSKNIDKLRAKMAPYMIRARKADVLKELPPLSFDTLPVPVSDKALHYAFPFEATDDEVMKIITAKDEHIATLRQLVGLAKVPGAVDVIINALDASDRRLLVYAQHHAVIDKLMYDLGEFRPVKIDGRDSDTQRRESVRRFTEEPDCRVFIGQLQAAGTAITLVGPKYPVSDVYFVEGSTNPGDNVQAASRIHRIGQPNAVQGWFLVAHGTFDDRVQDIIRRRTQDFYDLFN